MADPEPLVAAMAAWLERRLPGDAFAWFKSTLTALQGQQADKPLFIAFGLAPRKLGKADLQLSQLEIEEASAQRKGWDPRDWSVDQAARLCFLLATFAGDEARFSDRLQQFFRTADVGEGICLYRGLPLYPGQERLIERAREGTRTNIRAVFEAVAHRNPFPKERFSEAAWNQMILKALFIGTTLYPIQGLDERRNLDLARMLCDYAHERWAAGRPVSPELWRCVGRHADASMVDDLERALASTAELERQAAALALSECSNDRARSVLAGQPDLAAAIGQGRLTWDNIRP